MIVLRGDGNSELLHIAITILRAATAYGNTATNVALAARSILALRAACMRVFQSASGGSLALIGSNFSSRALHASSAA